MNEIQWFIEIGSHILDTWLGGSGPSNVIITFLQDVLLA